METSKLERKTRVLADDYMAKHPGVGRVTAKNRVRWIASVQVAGEQLAHALQTELRPVFRNVNRGSNAWLRAIDGGRDAWLEPTPSEPVRARPFGRASR